MTEMTDRFADQLIERFSLPDDQALETALQSVPAPDEPAPLFVELEGALIRERSVSLLVSKGWGQLGALFAALLRLPMGRGAFKHELAKRIEFNPATLPYNDAFLEWLWGERESDRPIWLLTSADQLYAKKIADYLGLFDGIIASTAKRSIRGDAKLSALRKKVDARYPFDYCGCALADLNLFAGARYAVLVGANASVQRHAVSQGNVSLVFD
jgi:hypothetical protein